MKATKVVAFDCDGVMFDSVKANTAYYDHILVHFGLPVMTPEQFVFANMHTTEKVLAHLFDDPEMLTAALRYRSRMSYRPFVREMEIEPYLKPLLQTIRPHYHTAIATNRTDSIGWVISDHGLEGFFDYVVSALDVRYPKPDPEPLLKILKHFRVAPHEALYVGDSELDEMAAGKAGIPLVAYNNPALNAAYHIRSLKELEVMLVSG
ncbi:MAG: HAD-IA family hydrolase [Desulfobacterales bacterium]|nr:HAD-IA family hydrolase [Desulfobacterales bacterium]